VNTTLQFYDSSNCQSFLAAISRVEVEGGECVINNHCSNLFTTELIMYPDASGVNVTLLSSGQQGFSGQYSGLIQTIIGSGSRPPPASPWPYWCGQQVQLGFGVHAEAAKQCWHSIVDSIAADNVCLYGTTDMWVVFDMAFSLGWQVKLSMAQCHNISTLTVVSGPSELSYYVGFADVTTCTQTKSLLTVTDQFNTSAVELCVDGYSANDRFKIGFPEASVVNETYLFTTFHTDPSTPFVIRALVVN